MLAYSTENYKTLIIHMFQKQSPPFIKSIPTRYPSHTHLNTNMDKIKMVVFDVYGTILHSRMGEISTLEQSNGISIDIPELQVHLDLQNTHSILQTLILEEHSLLKKKGIDYPEIDIVSIWQQFSRQYKECKKVLSRDEAKICALRYELTVNPVYPMPQAMHCLLHLQKAGYALGIISNAQFYTQLILETLYSEWHNLQFETCIWSYQQGIGKPSPMLYQLFLQQSGYKAHTILYIGNDKKKDIIPAKTVGMHPLLYAGDESSFRPHSPDLDAIEHTLIYSLDEILSLLSVEPIK